MSFAANDRYDRVSNKNAVRPPIVFPPFATVSVSNYGSQNGQAMAVAYPRNQKNKT
jgi:hypothetical protein